MPQGLDSCVSELIAVAIRIVTLVGVVCTAILIIFKSPFISLFVKDNLQVMNTSSEIITFYSVNFIFVGANIIINALYTAINNPRTSAILAILRYVLLIGNFFILPLILGNIGLWLSLCSGRNNLRRGKLCLFEQDKAKVEYQLVIQSEEESNR
ncbi:hypothetical protein MHB77_01070 [Paenibacillus sp. FSL K6-3166]|uniref:hypothetical protein n=1 Tax=unclassified Paenibacillus TaxID=185978 RepID=UPI000BA0A938|nr:hypothetical protein [Paenibacillus sp. VTT E-133291]OZQ98233.1 hypothetical protein CA598_01205 [Paenibacillus sp. VTT E-133291]